jgi:hypothetical protein
VKLLLEPSLYSSNLIRHVCSNELFLEKTATLDEKVSIVWDALLLLLFARAFFHRKLCLLSKQSPNLEVWVLEQLLIIALDERQESISGKHATQIVVSLDARTNPENIRRLIPHVKGISSLGYHCAYHTAIRPLVNRHLVNQQYPRLHVRSKHDTEAALTPPTAFRMPRLLPPGHTLNNVPRSCMLVSFC